MEYSSEKYYKELNGKKVICVDFDNTICLDEWPYIGPVIKDAIKVLKELQRNGHRLILFTQRTTFYPICCKELQEMIDNNGLPIRYRDLSRNQSIKTVDILSDAIKVFEDNHIELEDFNMNLRWEGATHDNARKVFADYFIDDHSVGMKYNIVENKFGEKCKVCDWQFIDKWFVQEGLYPKPVLSYYES